MSDLPLIAVAGPTGAGKSALALALAERFHGEIINFDSVQLYAGFDIGSAKVPLSERRGIPHHLIDLCAPTDLFTAGDFAAEVRALLPQLARRRRLPILCGGTGFYLRALLNGLSPGPARDEALRAKLLLRDQRRPGAIRRLLRRLDPEAAARIHPNDANKSIRALELRILARRPASAHFSSAGLEPLSGYSPFLIGLDPPRQDLYARLDLRCVEIWRGGLLDEVRLLLAAGVPPSAKPFESLGYKQALAYLTGPPAAELDLLSEMQLRTRQYAKRQWTWFRAEPNVHWLPGFGSDPALQHRAAAAVADFLKNFSPPTEHFLP